HEWGVWGRRPFSSSLSYRENDDVFYSHSNYRRHPTSCTADRSGRNDGLFTSSESSALFYRRHGSYLTGQSFYKNTWRNIAFFHCHRIYLLGIHDDGQ